MKLFKINIKSKGNVELYVIAENEMEAKIMVEDLIRMTDLFKLIENVDRVYHCNIVEINL